MSQVLLLLLFPLFCCGQSGAIIQSAGSTLHFRTFGSGEPLLIINGGPGMNSNGFSILAERLSNNRMTILYDQRATGKSKLEKADASTITMDLMVEDIENLRKHLKIEKWDILGHSFGGMLAAYYASKHPQRIKKMIMSSSGGVNLKLLDYLPETIPAKLTETERDSLAYWNLRLNSGESETARVGRARALAPAYVYDKKNAPVITQRLTEGNSAVNGLVWQNLRKIRFDLSKNFRNFQQPVLVIQGKNDILKISTAEETKNAFPNSELLLLDKCGHYGWLDRETEYFNAINNFLKT